MNKLVGKLIAGIIACIVCVCVYVCTHTDVSLDQARVSCCSYCGYIVSCDPARTAADCIPYIFSNDSRSCKSLPILCHSMPNIIPYHAKPYHITAEHNITDYSILQHAKEHIIT